MNGAAEGEEKAGGEDRGEGFARLLASQIGSPNEWRKDPTGEFCGHVNSSVM